MMFDFEKPLYFPIIRSRDGELKGYMRLKEEIKDNILPVVTLGKWRNQEGFDPALIKINESVGDRSIILDLTKQKKHQNAAIKSALQEDTGFLDWLEIVKNNKNIIPVVQMPNNSHARSIVQQALKLESLDRPLVFRITNDSNTEHTLSSLYALSHPERSLVIFDAGYIRDIATKSIHKESLEGIIKNVNKIRHDFPEVTLAISGTSFPRTVIPFLSEHSKTRGEIEILENQLFEELGSDIAKYSDHASIHSVVYDNEGGVFLPRIDVPKDESWLFERRPDYNDSEGYVDAAKSIIDRVPELINSDSWGARMIVSTSKRELNRIKSPVAAISVRVNLHITYQYEKQVELASRALLPEQFDDEFDIDF